MFNERKPNFLVKSCVQTRESTHYRKKEMVYCGEQGIRDGFEKKSVKDKQGSAIGLASVISRIQAKSYVADMYGMYIIYKHGILGYVSKDVNAD